MKISFWMRMIYGQPRSGWGKKSVVAGSDPFKSLIGSIHCGSQGVVDAILPTRTVRLKMRKDIAVDLQRYKLLGVRDCRPFNGWRCDLLRRFEQRFGCVFRIGRSSGYCHGHILLCRALSAAGQFLFPGCMSNTAVVAAHLSWADERT